MFLKNFWFSVYIKKIKNMYNKWLGEINFNLFNNSLCSKIYLLL